MKAALILSCVVFGVTAYNFEDPLYNQYLAKDFEALENEGEAPLHPRVRRQGQQDKCPRAQPPSLICCGAGEMEALHKDPEEDKKECQKELTGRQGFHAKPFDPFNCEDVEKRKMELICVKQCVAKRKGFANDDGSLIDEVLKKHILDHHKLEWLNRKLEDIISQCLTEAKGVTAEAGGCNPAFMKFGHCLFRETQLACPNDKITEPRRCEIIRQFAQTASVWPVPFH